MALQGSIEGCLKKESLVPQRISQIEDRQAEIQVRVETLLDRLQYCLMPQPPACEAACEKASQSCVPPIVERLDSLTRRQDQTLFYLSDILQRLEV